MEKFTRTLNTLRRLFLQVTEAGFALIGFIVLVYLLLGEDSGPYVISVMANVILVVNAVTPPALVGIAIVLALVYLVKRRP